MEEIKNIKGVAGRTNLKGEAHVIGRPSAYSIEIGNAICEQIIEGISLRKICASESMPGTSSVFRWLSENVTFREQYTRAKDEQAEALAEEMLEIADYAQEDTYTDAQGNVKTDNEVVARSRLKIETRKWIASKLKPHKYGDSMNLNHSGTVNLTDEQLESKLTILLGKARVTSIDGVKEIQGESTQG